LLSVDAHATDGVPRNYKGTLGDAGGTISFSLIKQSGKPLELVEFQFDNVTVTCDDGTTELVGAGTSWLGGMPSLPSHALDLDEVDSQEALHLHGKIQAIQGSGTLQWTTAALTSDERPQLCTTGVLQWTVARSVPPVAQAARSTASRADQGQLPQRSRTSGTVTPVPPFPWNR